MQTLYVPKYNIHYRVNPKNRKELQWTTKPFGPSTAWQHAITFKKPIQALDLDDKTKQGVVVLNDSSTYVGSGVRVWGRKYYPMGTRIFSLYAIGESKMNTMNVLGYTAKVITRDDANTYVYVVVADRDEALALKKKLKDNGITTMQATREATNYRVSFSIPNGKTLESKDIQIKQNCSMLRKQESIKETALQVSIEDDYIDVMKQELDNYRMLCQDLADFLEYEKKVNGHVKFGIEPSNRHPQITLSIYKDTSKDSKPIIIDLITHKVFDEETFYMFGKFTTKQGLIHTISNAIDNT